MFHLDLFKIICENIPGLLFRFVSAVSNEREGYLYCEQSHIMLVTLGFQSLTFASFTTLL